MRVCSSRLETRSRPGRRPASSLGRFRTLLGVVAAGLVLGVGSAAPVREGPKAGEELEVEIGRVDGKKVKMVFCRVPAGKATLVSPAAEADRRVDEAEREFATEGVWLGKNEVTQAEWARSEEHTSE